MVTMKATHANKFTTIRTKTPTIKTTTNTPMICIIRLHRYWRVPRLLERLLTLLRHARGRPAVPSMYQVTAR